MYFFHANKEVEIYDNRECLTTENYILCDFNWVILFSRFLPKHLNNFLYHLHDSIVYCRHQCDGLISQFLTCHMWWGHIEAQVRMFGSSSSSFFLLLSSFTVQFFGSARGSRTRRSWSRAWHSGLSGKSARRRKTWRRTELNWTEWMCNAKCSLDLTISCRQKSVSSAVFFNIETES